MRWVNIAGTAVPLTLEGVGSVLPVVDDGVATVTAGSGNTKGAWAEAVTSTSGDTSIVWLRPDVGATNGTNSACLLDIGVGPSGSETVVAQNLGIGHRSLLNDWIAVPLSIPAGSRIAFRQQSVTASRSITIKWSATQGMESASTVDTFGADTSGSRGTNAATSATFYELVAATPRAYRGILVLPTGVGTVWASASIGMSIGVGSAGAESVIASIDVNMNTGEAWTAEDMPLANFSAVDIPAGSRLSYGVTGTARAYIDCIVVGVPA